MVLKIEHFVIFVTIGMLTGCKERAFSLSKITANQVPIDSLLREKDSVSAFILPYYDRINEVLDSTLAYAPNVITKEDGVYNTSAGNLIADIILLEANPIFNSRTGQNIDFALMNHGGIRSIISKGKVSARTAYEVMPFENSIAVVELDGKTVQHLVQFLVRSKRPHPIAGLEIMINGLGELKSIRIQGEPFNENRNYFVATSDYLVSGGDDMVFFKDAINITDTDYLIRNAMIDYFKKVDTLRAAVDDRFVQIKN